MNRTCKKCGSIDFDIWGTVGLLGFVFFVSALGYSLSWIFDTAAIVVVGFVFGTILMLPMWFISFHEQRERDE